MIVSIDAVFAVLTQAGGGLEIIQMTLYVLVGDRHSHHTYSPVYKHHSECLSIFQEHHGA